MKDRYLMYKGKDGSDYSTYEARVSSDREWFDKNYSSINYWRLKKFRIDPGETLPRVE